MFYVMSLRRVAGIDCTDACPAYTQKSYLENHNADCKENSVFVKFYNDNRTKSCNLVFPFTKSCT